MERQCPFSPKRMLLDRHLEDIERYDGVVNPLTPIVVAGGPKDFCYVPPKFLLDTHGQDVEK